MKKLVSIFLALMVIVSGLIVINIYQTKEQERLENMEQTSDSFKIYVSNTAHNPSEMLEFFQKISDEKKVSIIRTDFPKNKIVKSGILNNESFPTRNFFAEDILVSLSKDAVYSSSKTDPTNKVIPSFISNPIIELQSLYKYFKNGDKSSNGIYTIIPNSNENKRGLLKDFSDFFEVSIDDLQTPKMQSRKEYINKYFLIYIGIFSVLSILTILSVLSIPITQVKNIGVWKLLGFKSKEVLRELFLLPYLTILIISMEWQHFFGQLL